MLQQALLDWWFSPWTYAPRMPARMLPSEDELGRRDGYRLWCEQAGIAADLPFHFDPAWSIAATSDSGQLRSAARLFAGLIAAREHDHALLSALPLAERKWCASIASVQPLNRLYSGDPVADDSLETRGLVDLALYLEKGFPGLWSRLRLLLPEPLAADVDALLQAMPTATDSSRGSVRAQRCWRLCADRAVTASKQPEKVSTKEEHSTAEHDVVRYA